MATVRPRTEADFEPLSDVIRATHAKTGYPLEGLPDARAFIIDDSAPLAQAWVAVFEGKIVGHIAINVAVPDCPAVSTWRAQGNKEERLAVVSRLFVDPNATGASRGVTKGLINAVTAWSQEHETRLIMYVVIWSAVRALMAEVLTARQGWLKYGDSVYHSPDGWSKQVFCYAQPLNQLYPHLPPQQDLAVNPYDQPMGDLLVRMAMQLSSTIWVVWNDPKRESSIHIHEGTCLAVC
ncbi:hypothetical protein LTR53_009247 [Teratosphaeriaceae sp. CCFEE 6253]|nr:hypothetical protein LTR53_009247 [Teratosphaeriaceae sp. CCFEE 6253]